MMSADLWVSGCDLRVSEPMLENGVQRSLKSITMPLFCEGVTTLGLFRTGAMQLLLLLLLLLLMHRDHVLRF